MFNQVIALFVTVFNAVFGWFVTFETVMSYGSVLFSMIFVCILTRLLLFPFFKMAGTSLSGAVSTRASNKSSSKKEK